VFSADRAPRGRTRRHLPEVHLEWPRPIFGHLVGFRPLSIPFRSHLIIWLLFYLIRSYHGTRTYYEQTRRASDPHSPFLPLLVSHYFTDLDICPPVFIQHDVCFKCLYRNTDFVCSRRLRVPAIPSFIRPLSRSPFLSLSFSPLSRSSCLPPSWFIVHACSRSSSPSS